MADGNRVHGELGHLRTVFLIVHTGDRGARDAELNFRVVERQRGLLKASRRNPARTEQIAGQILLDLAIGRPCAAIVSRQADLAGQLVGPADIPVLLQSEQPPGVLLPRGRDGIRAPVRHLISRSHFFTLGRDHIRYELENFLDLLLVFRLSEVSGSSFRRTWVTCECFAVPASARPACLAPLAVV